jgi:hypothetical protein
MKFDFDTTALTEPKTPEDVLAILAEIRAELDNVNSILDDVLVEDSGKPNPN